MPFCLGKMRVYQPKAAKWRRGAGLGGFPVNSDPSRSAPPSDFCHSLLSLCGNLVRELELAGDEDPLTVGPPRSMQKSYLDSCVLLRSLYARESDSKAVTKLHPMGGYASCNFRKCSARGKRVRELELAGDEDPLKVGPPHPIQES